MYAVTLSRQAYLHLFTVYCSLSIVLSPTLIHSAHTMQSKYAAVPLLQLPMFVVPRSSVLDSHPRSYFLFDILRRVAVYPPRYNPSMLLRLCYSYHVPCNGFGIHPRSANLVPRF
jgi:hypothetical protein